MNIKLIIWKVLILFLVVLFAPQIALSDTYTFANWQPNGFNYSAGPVYPDGDGNCIASLRQSLYPFPGDPVYGHIRYGYEDAEIKAYLTSEGLDLGIYHMHAKYDFGNSLATAFAREEFTFTGPGGATDALMNFEVTGTLFITDESIHVHQNNLRVTVSIRRTEDNQIVGLYSKEIAVWNDGGYGYINWIGGPVEFIDYTHDPWEPDPEPFVPIPGNGKMLIFNELPITVPISDLIPGEQYHYIVETRNIINHRGATDTFHTLTFDPDLPPIEFGSFDGDPEPGNFIPAPDQEAFVVQSEAGALGEITGGGDLQVDMDIKPGSDPNSIAPTNRGNVSVSILTTDTFDATTVDPLSVQFGPNGATETHGKGHIEDVDEDGDLDLVLHFNTQETGIACGDTEAHLTGETFDGQAIEGFDSINTVRCD